MSTDSLIGLSIFGILFAIVYILGFIFTISNYYIEYNITITKILDCIFPPLDLAKLITSETIDAIKKNKELATKEEYNIVEETKEPEEELQYFINLKGKIETITNNTNNTYDIVRSIIGKLGNIIYSGSNVSNTGNLPRGYCIINSPTALLSIPPGYTIVDSSQNIIPYEQLIQDIETGWLDEVYSHITEIDNKTRLTLSSLVDTLDKYSEKLV